MLDASHQRTHTVLTKIAMFLEDFEAKPSRPVFGKYDGQTEEQILAAFHNVGLSRPDLDSALAMGLERGVLKQVDGKWRYARLGRPPTPGDPV